MSPSRNPLADVDMKVWIDDPARSAILAGATDDREDAVWLPRSKIEVEYTNESMAIVTMPQWMAEERGLV